VTKALDFSLADRKAELLRWLSEEGRFAPDTGGLLEMLCEKLTMLGAPIARATVHVRTLHPEFRGVSRIQGIKCLAHNASLPKARFCGPNQLH